MQNNKNTKNKNYSFFKCNHKTSKAALLSQNDSCLVYLQFKNKLYLSIHKYESFYNIEK